MPPVDEYLRVKKVGLPVRPEPVPGMPLELPSPKRRAKAVNIGAARIDMLATGVRLEDLPPTRQLATRAAIKEIDKEDAQKQVLAQYMFALWKAAGNASQWSEFLE